MVIWMSRLSREDWVSAAAERLRERGARTVSVEAIARALGVSKGSFYWHFKDRSALIEALLEGWEKLATTAIIADTDRAGGIGAQRVLSSPMVKKREDRSLDKGAFDNPFAGLAALREELPEGERSEAPAVDDDDDEPTRATRWRVRKERKGRGGKTVTLVEGAAPKDREALAAQIKKALGTGARVEGEAVVVQGDLVERVRAFVDAL